MSTAFLIAASTVLLSGPSSPGHYFTQLLELPKETHLSLGLLQLVEDGRRLDLCATSSDSVSRRRLSYNCSSNNRDLEVGIEVDSTLQTLILTSGSYAKALIIGSCPHATDGLILGNYCLNSCSCRVVPVLPHGEFSFDVGLFFAGWQSHFEDTLGFDIIHNSKFSLYPLLCSGLHSTLFPTSSSEPRFVSYTQETKMSDIANWMFDLCQMSPVIVKQSLITTTLADVGYSFCNVLSVSGLPMNITTSAMYEDFDVKQDVPYCMEDVLRLIASRTSLSSASSGSFTFLSFVGMEAFTRTQSGIDAVFDLNAPDLSKAHSLDELISVMKAYKNLQAEGQFPLNKAMFIVSALRETQMALNDDETVSRMKRVRQAMYSIFTVESERFGCEDATDPGALLVEIREEAADEAYRVVFLLTIHSALSDYTAFTRGERFCDTEGVYRLICTDTKLRGEFLELVLLAISAEKDIEHRRSYTPFLDSFERRLRYFLGDEENKAINYCRPPAPKTKEPIMAGSADIHVVAFVREKDRLYAEDIVEYWHKVCHHCSYYVRYNVLTVEDEVMIPSQDGDSGLLRSSLLMLYDMVSNLAIKIDVVVCMIGVNAMLRFHPPKSLKETFSIIPSLQYGSNAPINLPNDIVFSWSGTTSTSNKPLIDPHIFAGVFGTVRHMLREIKSDFSYAYTGSSQISFAIQRYVECNSEYVYIDDKFEKFAAPLDAEINILAKIAELIDEAQKTWNYRIQNSIGVIKHGIKHKYVPSFQNPIDDRNVDFVKELNIFQRNIRISDNESGWKDSLQGVFDATNQFIHQGNWIELFETMKILYDELIRTKYIWMPIFNTFMIGKYAHQFSNELEISCIRRLVLSMQDYVRRVDILNYMRIDVTAVKAAASSLLKEIGWTRRAVEWFATSLEHGSYEMVQKQRKEWKIAKSRYIDSPYSSSATYKMHFVTMASDASHEGLVNLKTSAELSGIDLIVLGVGETYGSYDDKLKRYYSFLHDPSSVVKDDDLVVFVDAYDVLLFPQSRRLHDSIAHSASPVLACSESGVYPEPMAPWFYPRGEILNDIDLSVEESHAFDASFVSNRGQPRFLNSGCIVGRAHDQQAFVRFSLMAPHILTVDMPRLVKSNRSVRKSSLLGNHTLTTDYEYGVLYKNLREYPNVRNADLIFTGGMMMTGYRSILSLESMPSLTATLTFHRGIQQQIGILHCNNKKSNQLYSHVVSTMNMVRSNYYSGPDSGALLKALHLKVDGNFEESFDMLTNLSSTHQDCSVRVVCMEETHYSTPVLTWKDAQRCKGNGKKTMLQRVGEDTVSRETLSSFHCNPVPVLLFDELLQEL